MCQGFILTYPLPHDRIVLTKEKFNKEITKC
jgi:hypothetical protein